MLKDCAAGRFWPFIKEAIMTFEKWIAAGVVAAALSAGPAYAADDDCTDDALTARQEALGAYLQEHPEKVDMMGDAVAKVEEKYGGEPPREKQCQAIDELLEEVKAL